MQEYLQVSEEVSRALAQGGAVVALESTIISHGMPYPKNVETAIQVEQIVRDNGAVPATIAILAGKVVVGASKEQIDYFGRTGFDVPKASRRDLAALLAAGRDGATTVATTMIAAARAGIQVFATGGIGGVHRGGENTMDISADLTELKDTDVLVVCAGCKSILDIGLTLEHLETGGVPVIGYGTDEFPAFYARNSGFGVDYRLNTPREVAEVWKAKHAFGLRGGVVLANPVPAEYEMDSSAINAAIEAAVAEAEQAGVRGKRITPFLLARISEITGGGSLDTNIRLVYNNAKVAAQVADALSKL